MTTLTMSTMVNAHCIHGHHCKDQCIDDHDYAYDDSGCCDAYTAVGDVGDYDADVGNNDDCHDDYDCCSSPSDENIHYDCMCVHSKQQAIV